MFTDTTFTPDEVQSGVRDYIAWKAKQDAEVSVSPQSGGFEVSVTTAQVADEDGLRKELEELLPHGYTLSMTMT